MVSISPHLGEAVALDKRCVGGGLHRQLASRNGIIPQLIAETGGQNAMIVDSTALPEQVIRDTDAGPVTDRAARQRPPGSLYCPGRL